MSIDVNRSQVYQLAVSSLLVLAFTVLRLYFGWQLPGWANWIGIAIAVIIGADLMIRPRQTPYMRPIFARTLGIAIIFIAVNAAFSQLSSK
ncbi:hypothetical protein [Sphingomonas beigongshangi]|uniref:hypothetical protein n=1 Tax=Sphingomonas beigongshangi TaxID=2782540 RepID=UPI00193B9B56|nr:hypothetical protein [Sphingomonas beigongshangi]